jgi:hypothetical protein
VLKVDKDEFDLGLQQFLLWNDGVDDILNLHPGVTCFMSARVRCHELPVKLESQR